MEQFYNCKLFLGNKKVNHPSGIEFGQLEFGESHYVQNKTLCCINRWLYFPSHPEKFFQKEGDKMLQ